MVSCVVAPTAGRVPVSENATRKPDLVASAMSWGTASRPGIGVCDASGTAADDGPTVPSSSGEPGPMPAGSRRTDSNWRICPSESRAVPAMFSSASTALSGCLAAMKRPPSACAMTAVREWATMSCISRAMRVRSAIAASSARSRREASSSSRRR